MEGGVGVSTPGELIRGEAAGAERVCVQLRAAEGQGTPAAAGAGKQFKLVQSSVVGEGNVPNNQN